MNYSADPALLDSLEKMFLHEKRTQEVRSVISSLEQVDFAHDKLHCMQWQGRSFFWGAPKSTVISERLADWLGVSNSSLRKVKSTFESFVKQNSRWLDAYAEARLIEVAYWLNTKIDSHNRKLCFLFKSLLGVNKISQKLFNKRELNRAFETMLDHYYINDDLSLKKCALGEIIKRFEDYKEEMYSFPSNIQQDVANVLLAPGKELPVSYLLKYLPGIEKLDIL